MDLLAKKKLLTFLRMVQTKENVQNMKKQKTFSLLIINYIYNINILLGLVFVVIFTENYNLRLTGCYHHHHHLHQHHQVHHHVHRAQ